jgi:predicted metalloprotease with PDZ domain
MRTSIRRAAACWIALLTAAVVSAQPSSHAAIAFTVSTPDPATHLYHVTMRCEGLRGPSAEFRMPVWTPGYYGMFDFAGNVRNFAVNDATGHPLAFKKSGPNAWTVTRTAGSALTLSYDVFANNPFVATAFLDDTRGYITPGALFLYVPGRLREPVHVTIDLNSRWNTVATGLEPVKSGARHTYRAEDFDVLYDSPILIGNLEALPPFQIGGIPHDFVGYGMEPFDRTQFMDDLHAVVEAGTKIIGDVPYTHYTFLGIGPGMGGIEHLNSAAVSFKAPGSDRAARIRTLSFLAHEYFHHYNVKRIRPIALGPFDYDKANLTNMLWVSEGFTVYYEYIMLGRSGRMTRNELLDAMGRTIASYENSTGRLFQSATQSSWETWDQGPFGGGRAAGIKKTISYYEKGPALGMLLDFAIRHQTKNERSLDTVMRTLYQRYYKGLKRGWTDDEFRQVCEEIAGGALAEVFEYASTTKPIDYAKYLAYAGLELEAPTELPDAYLGAVAEDVNGKTVIAALEPGSPAAAFGLAAGDVITAVDGKAVADAEALASTVTAKGSGDPLVVSVDRKDGAHEVRVILARAQKRSRPRPGQPGDGCRKR